MSDIEIAAERVVEKNAVGDSVTKDDVKRHRDVERIGARVVSECVAVPHREAVAAELPAAFVQWAVLLAEGVNVFVVAEALPDAARGARKSGAARADGLTERRAAAEVAAES